MGRRIIRRTVNLKSGLDFLLIPLIRLFSKDKQKDSPQTAVESTTYYLSTEEQGKEAPIPRPDNYIEQVLKYIPSEIVAAYLFLDGILRSSDKVTGLFFWAVFLFLLLVTPFYIWAVTSEKAEETGVIKKPAWDQIIVSFFSFAVWVFAIGGPFTYLSWYDPVYGSTLLVLFTFLPPIVSKIVYRTCTLLICRSENTAKM